MKGKSLVIATCLLLAVLSFLVLPAYATSPTQDPLAFIKELIEGFISFLVGLVKAFLAFLAKLFGA